MENKLSNIQRSKILSKNQKYLILISIILLNMIPLCTSVKTHLKFIEGFDYE